MHLTAGFGTAEGTNGNTALETIREAYPDLGFIFDALDEYGRMLDYNSERFESEIDKATLEIGNDLESARDDLRDAEQDLRSAERERKRFRDEMCAVAEALREDNVSDSDRMTLASRLMATIGGE